MVRGDEHEVYFSSHFADSAAKMAPGSGLSLRARKMM
jgi:hypothetical protein